MSFDKRAAVDVDKIQNFHNEEGVYPGHVLDYLDSPELRDPYALVALLCPTEVREAAHRLATIINEQLYYCKGEEIWDGLGAALTCTEMPADACRQRRTPVARETKAGPPRPC